MPGKTGESAPQVPIKNYEFQVDYSAFRPEVISSQ